MRYLLFLLIVVTAGVSLSSTGGGASIARVGAQEGEFYLPPMTPYRVCGNPSEQFQEFFSFELDYEPGQNKLIIQPNGEARAEGYILLTNHTTYRFKSASLVREKRGFMKLMFQTEDIRGEHYGFQGEFVHPARFSNGEFTELEGTLTRYKGETIAAQAKMEFYSWAYE